MVAAVFIAVSLIAIASAFTNASHILQKSRHNLTAIAYLQKWAEFYRNAPFSAMPECSDVSLDISDAPLPAPHLLEITIQYYDAVNGIATTDETSGIKKISLKAEWNEDGETFTKKTTTLITDGGINP